MVIYIGVFIYNLFVMLYIHRASNRFFKTAAEISIIFVLCFVVGFSNLFQISDIKVYQFVYGVTPTLSKFNFSTVHTIYGTFEMEKGFLFIISILKTLGINFRGFFLLRTIFFLFAFYYGLKRYTEDFAIVVVLFLYKIFCYNLFISLRQSTTLAIFFIIVHYIEEKKIIKYFIGCFIASTIHYAAIILFPIYFIRFFQLTKKRLIYLLAGLTPLIFIDVTNLALFFTKRIPNMTIQRKMFQYLEYTSPINILHTLEYFIIIFLILLFYKKIVIQNEHAEFIIKLILILLPLFTVFRSISILTRMKDYFTIFYGVIFSYFYTLNWRGNRYIIYIFAIGLSLFGYARFILLFGGGKSLLPYQNIIFDLFAGK